MPDRDAAPAGSADASPAAASASIVLLVSRRMRAPLVTLILVYAVSVLGLSLIPGVDAQGRPAAPLSLFHALYVVGYTATTIGFGELPGAFSNAQRMWIMVVIHLAVIGWTYSVLTLIALFQDPAFQRAVSAIRFGRRVRRLGEPFLLILGCGDTGQRLIRVLDRQDRRFVVVEKSEARIAELELEDFRTDAPVINGDARSPQVLVHAGIGHRHCIAALALTNDDRANLAVAAAARLLNPRLRVLARAHTPAAAENLRSFDADHIIDPFETFADHLVLAMRAPGAYRLLRWLSAPPGARLAKEHEPPRGSWVICGYGRFGRAIRDALAGNGVITRIIDPIPPEGAPAAAPAPIAPAPAVPSWTAGAGAARSTRPPHPHDALEGGFVVGVGTERDVLERARIAEADGLVAGTDDDIANLAIVAMARRLNPKLFTVIRQNETVNEPLFERIRADLVLRPSEIIAEEALALLSTPLLGHFLDEVRRQTDGWADEVIHQLRDRMGTRAPKIWTVTLDPREAPALALAWRGGVRPLVLGELMRDPGRREQPLEARALMLLRDGQRTMLPGDEMLLQPGDRILFAGRGDARRRLALTLADVNALEYLRTGRDLPGGRIWRRRAQG